MNRIIASLAMINANYSKYKRDYIENFIPFVATLIKLKNYQFIELTNLQSFISDFQQEFGLIIPYHPMLTILERARKRGVVNKFLSRLNPNQARLDEYDFSASENKKEIELDKLFDEFTQFCQSKYSFSVSREEAQNFLLLFLKSHDLDVLFGSQDRTVLPSIAPMSPKIKYAFSSFVSEIARSRPELFGAFVEISIGHILANTVLYTEDLRKYQGKFEKINLYLDVRFIFRLLGIEGEAYQNAYQEMVKALLEQKAKLFVFRHTIDEMIVILRNCLTWLNHTNYDPSKASSVLIYFINNGKSETDIDRYIATLETKLENHKIFSQDAPDYKSATQIDETRLKELIIDAYSRNTNFNETEKQATIDLDIKTLTSIYHLRKGNLPQTIKQAGSFFVTTNSTLANISKNYQGELYDSGYHIPVCITDVFLGTLAWMQSPKKWVSLNKKKFLADCSAALQPDGSFIKKMISEAEKLRKEQKITSEEYQAINSYYFVKSELMEKTLGDPDEITSDSIEDVVRKIETNATGRLQGKIEVVEREKEEYKASFEETKLTNEKLENIIKKIVDVFLSYIYWVIVAAFIFLTVFGCFVTWPKYIKVILGLLSTLGICFGINILKLKAKFREYILKRFGL